MNPFDMDIIQFLNQFSHHSRYCDSVIQFMSENKLVKGTAVILVFWWGWFSEHQSKRKTQIGLISTLVSCFVAMVIARAMAILLPFRFRPVHTQSLEFQLPYSVSEKTLDGWSSFPSDHGVLFYALSIGLFCISKRVGWLAVTYVSLFIALPRIYLGLHYPTDILIGGLIGAVVTWFFHTNPVQKKIGAPLYEFSISKPQFFYPVLFLVTFQICDMFESARSAAWLVKFTLGSVNI